MSLDDIARRINKMRNSNVGGKIIVMVGAGVSTAAGIPDFRSPGTGLYANLQQYKLSNPQDIFSIDYLCKNPKPFFHLAKELYPTKFEPTMSHYFIRLLADESLLLRVYTQNVDTLERCAGISEDLLIEAHGAFDTAHCITCRKEYNEEFIKKHIFDDKIPYCEVCKQSQRHPHKGLVKPDIVFFGESLPKKFLECASKDMTGCELLIIMGTSLTVQPFASLINRVPDDCPRLLINLDEPRSVHSGRFGDHRDVFCRKSCDEGSLELAKMLNLEDKLRKLMKLPDDVNQEPQPENVAESELHEQQIRLDAPQKSTPVSEQDHREDVTPENQDVNMEDLQEDNNQHTPQENLQDPQEAQHDHQEEVAQSSQDVNMQDLQVIQNGDQQAPQENLQDPQDDQQDPQNVSMPEGEN